MKRTEEMPVEYALICSCGKGLRLELTEHEQKVGKLRRTTQILANLFDYFHVQHGTVEGGFALSDTAACTRAGDELPKSLERL